MLMWDQTEFSAMVGTVRFLSIHYVWTGFIGIIANTAGYFIIYRLKGEGNLGRNSIMLLTCYLAIYILLIIILFIILLSPYIGLVPEDFA